MALRERFLSMLDALRDRATRGARTVPGAALNLGRHWYSSPARFALWFALTAIFVLLVNWIPQGLVAVVTMTVEARTEIVAFDIEADERMDLPLPPGQFALFSAEPGAACDARSAFDIVCRVDGTSVLRIAGPAHVELSLLRADEARGGPALPRILVQARPLPERAATAAFTINPAGRDATARTRDAIDFESEPVGIWRTQLNLSNVTLGTILPESTIAEPYLSDGRVRFFARIGGSSAGRFLVASEDLDPEDIVRLDTDRRCPLTWGDLLTLRVLFRQDCQIGIAGPIALAQNPGRAADTFEITLHSNRSSLPIERPRGGHVIRVSNWEIVSGQPALLAIWAAFISLMLIVNYAEGQRTPRFARVAAKAARARPRSQRGSRTPRVPPSQD